MTIHFKNGDSKRDVPYEIISKIRDIMVNEAGARNWQFMTNSQGKIVMVIKLDEVTFIDEDKT